MIIKRRIEVNIIWISHLSLI